MSQVCSRKQAIGNLTAAGRDYELVLEDLYGRPCRTFKNGPQTLRQLFQDTRSDAVLIVYEDERYSYAEAYSKASLIARLLMQHYHIQKGDRVAISMRNYPEWILAFTAITSIGAVAVAMNALWTSEEMAFGLADSGAKVLFADQERVDRVVPVLNELDLAVIAVRPTAALPNDVSELSGLLELLTKEISAQNLKLEMPVVEVSPFDDATLLYTSGSTGHPKGAVSCHRNVVSALMSWELEANINLMVNDLQAPVLESQAATLLAVPLFHATGLLAALLLSYRAQRKVVLMFKWNVEQATSLIEAELINSFVAPAAMTGDLVEAAKRTDKDLSSLDVVGGGGAPRAPEQVKRIAKAFGKALPNTGWGMTETNAIGAGIGGEDYLAHPASSGRCSAVLDMKVVDESGETLGVDQRGELLIKGTSIIRGYWQRPEANAETFDDGWLRTGDVATIDVDGYLYIVDRIKDLVIRGGENIGCAEVEAALLIHNNILEASVYAVPDARLGEEVGATIYVDEDIDEAHLRDFLLQHIAKFKLPKYIAFSKQALPRIASGKIDKRNIREAAVSNLQGS